MQITHINKIRNHRIFRDFTWTANLGEFKDYNLIYGWNGSGKTILANIFRSLEKRVPITEGEVEITIDNSRRIRGADFGTDIPLPQIRVFTRDFVRENVFVPEGDFVSPIYFIGKDNIDKRKELDNLKSKRKTMQGDLDQKSGEYRELDKQLDNFYIDMARAIKEVLRSSGTNPYNNYDKSNFKNKCYEIIKPGAAENLVLDDANKGRLKATKDALIKEKIPTIALKFADLTPLHNTASNILKEIVVADVIEALRNDTELNQWVKTGLDEHRKRVAPTCLFCGSRLPSGLLERLEGHFNDAYNAFINRLDGHVKKIKDSLVEPKYVDKANLYDEIASDYEDTRLLVHDDLVKHNQYLSDLTRRLSEKKNNPFKALDLDIQQPLTDQSRVDALNSFIDNHNSKTENFNNEVRAAREALEKSYVAEVSPQFKEKLGKCQEVRDACDTCKNELAEIDRQISEIEKDIVSHKGAADELNQDLEKYLGHSEIRFAVNEKDAGYMITRNGTPADALSEGEKTAVAFLYFLKSLEDREFTLNGGIVVIDDPISSLDSNALYHAFAYMKERTKGANQLFILTHNFTFFRQVNNWFTHIRKPRHSTFFMIKNKHAGAQRESFLAPLDPLLRNFQTEYHYLFNIVKKGTDASADLQSVYVLANVTRRLLEAFLLFKYPGSKDLYDRLQEVVFDSDKKEQILRFTHTYSHNNLFDDSGHDVSNLSEAPKVLKHVLELIREVDPLHYNAMMDITQ